MSEFFRHAVVNWLSCVFQSWKHRPGRSNNRWIDQLRRDNNNTPPAPVEKIHHTWSDVATVLDDYALMPMTTCILELFYSLLDFRIGFTLRQVITFWPDFVILSHIFI